MGSYPSKPAFLSVMADQQVRLGQNVTLCCEANTGEVEAKWQKNDYHLQLVHGKHTGRKSGRIFTLEIMNVNKEDQGKYTLQLTNSSGDTSCSAMVIVELNEWRTAQWKIQPMITTLKNFKINNEKIRELRFLLHGPIGAGKSSTINTIKTIFEGHQFINCLAAADADVTGMSFTKKYEKFSFEKFAFYDVMGLEEEQLKGVRSDDIIKALKGHIPDNYEFKQECSMSEDNRYYIRHPTLKDQIHCLVSVIAADKVALMDGKVIRKMKDIRAEASKLRIPQLVFMTKVDLACTMTEKDLTKIYKSKMIKEKMEHCSIKLGVPVNCIFPVMNYHSGSNSNISEKLNCLMLEAFTQAAYSANDYVKKFSHNERDAE
ncbi:hypothetical protein SRHO_G00113970 [Serrasalmus rhombeus]